jgi:hypothetical protein
MAMPLRVGDPPRRRKLGLHESPGTFAGAPDAACQELGDVRMFCPFFCGS